MGNVRKIHQKHELSLLVGSYKEQLRLLQGRYRRHAMRLANAEILLQEVYKGCPGVCNNAYTLSGKGFPCQNDPTSLKCAWCTMTGFQCYPDKWNGPDSKQGSRCQKQTNQKYCKSVQGDCRHIPGACPAERCVKVKDINKYMKYYECQCPEGYEGNGIQCFDTTTGEQLVQSDQYVELDLTLSQNISTFPFDGSNLPTGVELQNLINEMGNVAGSCSGACEATFNESVVEN